MTKDRAISVLTHGTNSQGAKLGTHGIMKRGRSKGSVRSDALDSGPVPCFS